MVALNIHEVVMRHMVTVLKHGPFLDSLCKKPTMNLDELRQRAVKFMQLEEMKEFQSSGT